MQLPVVAAIGHLDHALFSPLVRWWGRLQFRWHHLPSVRYAADKWAVLRKLASGTSATIDGKLREAWWEEATQLTGFRTAYYEQPVADGDVQYRLAYDDEFLYIGGTLSQHQAESLHKIEVVMRVRADR
ncbi:MAG: hypothetical protein ACOX4G_09085 [Limnochordia bacterium]